ncbi:VirB9 protein precursor, partial [Rickettsia endosymbiont of Ixodes scapularis]
MTIVRFYFLVFILLSGFTVQRECPLVDDPCNSSSNNYVDDLSI